MKGMGAFSYQEKNSLSIENIYLLMFSKEGVVFFGIVTRLKDCQTKLKHLLVGLSL